MSCVTGLASIRRASPSIVVGAFLSVHRSNPELSNCYGRRKCIPPAPSCCFYCRMLRARCTSASLLLSPLFIFSCFAIPSPASTLFAPSPPQAAMTALVDGAQAWLAGLSAEQAALPLTAPPALTSAMIASASPAASPLRFPRTRTAYANSRKMFKLMQWAPLVACGRQRWPEVGFLAGWSHTHNFFSPAFVFPIRIV